MSSIKASLMETKGFLSDAKKELKKVHWPDKPTVIETTLVVAVCTTFFAVFLKAVDLIIYQVFSLFYN